MNKFWAAITVSDKRWFGQVQVGPGTRVMLALLCTLLILEQRDRNAVVSGAERPLTLQLGGQRDFESANGPVYRRFAWLSIELHGAAANELDGVALILDELRGEEERRVVSVLNRQPQWRSIGLNRARAELKLESQDGPLAVGSYRLVVYRRERGGSTQRVQKRFSVIFNALHPADREAYHLRAAEYLADRMHIMQRHRPDSEPQLYDWQLDIHEEPVFELALQTVTGSTTPQSAVERVTELTVEQLEGFWPELNDVNGQVPSGTPSRQDEQESPPSIYSISERLRSGAPHAQCFDYTALSVALLRCIGIPARATSVMDPENMEHPYDIDRQVSWNYHVWTEVFLHGSWQAMDIAYLDGGSDGGSEQPAHEQPQPHLQPFDGPWFVRIIGPDSRVWRQSGNRIVEVTRSYQGRGGLRAQPNRARE